MTTTDRKPSKRTLAKAATRQKAIDVAKILFDGPDGYEGATIRDIAKAMGMSTGAVFANFADKAHLYRTIYGHRPVTVQQGAELLRHVERMLAAPLADDHHEDVARLVYQLRTAR